MKKLLDAYLQIYEILDDAQIEVISTKNSFGLGVTIVDKATGKTLTISEKSYLHMHKIEKKALNLADDSQTNDDSLLEQYIKDRSKHAYNKLVIQLQPIINHVIESLSTPDSRGSKLFLNLRSGSLMPDILIDFSGEEDDLEHYVAKELKYRLEIALKERVKISNDSKVQRGSSRWKQK